MSEHCGDCSFCKGKVDYSANHGQKLQVASSGDDTDVDPTEVVQDALDGDIHHKVDKDEAKKIARDTAAKVTAAEAKKAEKDAKADKRSGGGDVAGKHAAQYHHHHHADPNRESKVKAKKDADKDVKDDEAAKEDFEGKDVSEVLGGGTSRQEPSSVASLVQGKCAGWCGEKLSKCKGWVSGERAKGEHEYTMAECREGTEEKICMSEHCGDCSFCKGKVDYSANHGQKLQVVSTGEDTDDNPVVVIQDALDGDIHHKVDKAEAKKIARDTAAKVTAAEAKKAQEDIKADKRSGGGDVAGKHAAQWHHHHHADPNRASKVKAKEDAEKDIKDDEAAKADFESVPVSEVLGGTARKEPPSAA